MTHDYLIAWRSSEFLVLLSWQIMTLILKVVFIRLRGHHLLTADCPMDGRHINELIWDRNSSLEYSQYEKSWIKVIRLFKIVITSQIMLASQTSGPPKNIEIIDIVKKRPEIFLIFLKWMICQTTTLYFQNYSIIHEILTSLAPWAIEKLSFYLPKGQLISKRFFGVVDFLQKTNENMSHTSKNELIRSFFWGNRWPQKPFRN